MQDFVHLHVHTQYSILDGQASVSRLVDKALRNGMKGMAITDHGNMMGIKEFFNYTNKVKGKAKDELKKFIAKRAALEANAYTPVLDKNGKDPDSGKTKEQLLEECQRAIDENQRVMDFKPIFGCEMYVARRTMKDREGKPDQGGWHLVVLAQNEVGYHNLIKLVSNAWTDGFYMRPRTERAQLEKYKEGLIISSACIGGEVPKKILAGQIEDAEEAVKWYKKTFGDNYYLELQRHEVPPTAERANRETFPLQQRVNTVLLELSKKYQVKLICTNDSHFVDEENAEGHDRLICLSTGRDLTDPTRMLYSKQEWFKTREEMNVVFSDVPEALSNTCDICDRVETYSIDHGPIMPNFDIPVDFGTEETYKQNYTEKELFDEFTQDENGRVVVDEETALSKIKKLGGYEKLYRIKLEADYLAMLAYKGAELRYGKPLSKEVDDRIRFELHVMKTMGFPGYFLIVQDYINAAREELGVSVGPGRGSAAGSVVAYCLGITLVDPIKYDLLFERFLNPDRISLPDIDVDFDDDGRGKVLKWVTDKYGAEKVAHIITYGTMATKLAIKDVARVEKLPLDESNRLCKLIPDRLPEVNGKSPKMNLLNAIQAIPELREAETSNSILLSDTIKYAKMLEGNVRNTGVHACGFIICKDEISDHVPVSTADDKESGEKLRCTQYEGSVIEETGLIKMDFLGLKTLSIIKEALININESLGLKIDIEKIDIEDSATFQLYCDGLTIGTFQFESAGMQKYLRELQPSTFEDLIAMNALYRPGPMAYIPSFIARKHGREPITYDLDCMEKYLKDTYGITVYQEQVMLLSREIANFTRGESDTLRKAMGKKLIDKLNHMYPKFVAGGKANGHDEKTLEKIWNDWRAFASYAFNKSHATCYSWVAYQTAYLKANYPAQYMAAVMSRSLANITDITKLMDECKAMNINTLGPDVNESVLKFGVNHSGNIRFGLGAVKGVGEAAVLAIIKERKEKGPFTSIYNFVERVNLSACNKKSLENLVLAGAFDGFKELCREQFFAENTKGENFIEQIYRYGTRFQYDILNAQTSLFGDDEAVEIAKPEASKYYEPWSDLVRLNKERDLVGIYISAHPLDEYSVVVENVCSMRVANLNDLEPLANRDVTLGGIVTSLREGQTRKGSPFGVVTIEDYEGSGEIFLLGQDWAAWRNYMVIGNSLFITAHVEARRWDPSKFDLHIAKIEFLNDVKDHIVKKLTINIRLDSLDAKLSTELATVICESPGSTELYINAIDIEKQMTVALRSRTKKVSVKKSLIAYLKENSALEYKIN
ncbi:MAG: DNA polymerase III subunit alpha [Bacteroidaceae bacterium]